ncbi:gamma-glutamyl-gamma-aminobutyrate hydrolase family protein [Streptomyces sp. CA-294286]|uniref:gamma-glutamyl-gamma-aminobutyrate hydrolase family protein n=1 Tax=Streptomyces sp. CA-294286 TaxID=3240070 RepID=UPI003D8F1158
MSVKPLVGISTYLESSVRWGVWELPAALVPAGYPQLVQASGGSALLLPPDDPAYAAQVVARLDALVIAGGPDVDPVRYAAERDPRTGPPATARDAWELALIRAALDSRTPLLGVCRGMQLLNVALGGTLVQHLDGHAVTVGAFGTHPVRTVPGTRCAEILPGSSDVPAYHHQAVLRVGEGLVVSAYTADGTVEAVELPGESWALGVQWHPEMGTDLRLTQALVSAALSTPDEAGAAGADGVLTAGRP